jgi:hypothetical protein
MTCERLHTSSVPSRLCSKTSFFIVHSLEEIGEQCLAFDQTLKPLVDRAVPLTDYAWKFHYPGEPEEPSLSESQDAFTLAREVYDAILSRLPAEVRP